MNSNRKVFAECDGTTDYWRETADWLEEKSKQILEDSPSPKTFNFAHQLSLVSKNIKEFVMLTEDKMMSEVYSEGYNEGHTRLETNTSEFDTRTH